MSNPSPRPPLFVPSVDIEEAGVRNIASYLDGRFGRGWTARPDPLRDGLWVHELKQP